MPQFRKKPVVIEAVQFGGDSGPSSRGAALKFALDGLGSAGVRAGTDMKGHYMEIVTREGVMRADEGDWIICGVKGEFYPCKPEIFAASYEPVYDQQRGNDG